MKVLWFVNNLCESVEYLNPNAIECGWLYSLCKKLRQVDGVELHIAFLWGEDIDSFRYKDVVYHPILKKGMNSRLGRGWNRICDILSDKNDKIQLLQCMHIIHKVSPDIIHVHGTEDMFGLITRYDDLHVPVVLSIQGLLSVYRLKYYSGPTRNEILHNESIKKKITLSGYNGNFYDFSKRAKRETEILASLQYVIGRTQWDRRCAHALNPRIRYFKVNEILRPEFMSATWQCRRHGECFELATTISSGIYKGLEVIYQTAQLLTNMNFPFVWKIIGLSSNNDLVKIVEKICNLHANDIHVELLGAKRANEMVQVLLNSDMYVQTSHIENSPNSLCEAMALGMPIIASCAGGTSSMLKDEKEGIIIQDGNFYELAGAIMEASQNYALAVKMGEMARTRALPRHNPNNVADELIVAYNTIIQVSK